MIERAVQFGEQRGLVGVLCEPASEVRHVDGPAVLLLTAGVLHRVGPFRAYVDLSRRLAKQGFVSLRFDVSGVGDSQLRTGKLERLSRTLADVQNAMDLVGARCQIDRFVVAGLCTGAYYSHQAALVDPRIVGAVMLDGYAYRTCGYYRRYWWTRLRETRRWGPMLTRCFHRLLGGRNSMYELGALEEAEFFDRYPPRAQVRKELHALVEQGTKLLAIYSGGTELFNAREQFVEMYGSFGKTTALKVEYFGRADHTFSRVADRRQMIERVATWMDEQFGRAWATV